MSVLVKTGKIAGIILAGTALVLAAGYFFIVKTVTAPWLQDKLQQRVSLKTDSLYTLTLDSLFLDIPAGTIQLIGVDLKPNKDLPKGKASLTVSFDALEINRVHWLAFLVRKKLHFKSIRLKNPEIKLAEGLASKTSAKKTQDDAEEDSARSVQELLQTIPPAVRKIAQSLQVDTLAIEGAHLEVRGSGRMNVDSLSAFFRNLYVSGDKESPVTATNFNVTAKGFDLRPKGNYYHFKVRDIAASVFDSTFSVQRFELRTQQTDDGFFKRKKHRDIRYLITGEQLTVENWDYLRLLFDQHIDAEKVSLGWLRLDLLSDNRLPKKASALNPRYRRFPHEQFQQLKQALHIDTVFINRLDFIMREFPDGSGEAATAGLFTIEKAHVTLTGLGKEKGQNVPADTAMVLVKGKLMGKAETTISLEYPMRPGAWDAVFKGKIVGLKASDLNPMTGPLARLSFKEKAKINRLEFISTVKNGKATGWIDAEYEDLQINMLRKDSDRRRVVASMVGNWVILDNNISRNGKEIRKGKIDHKRDTTKGFPSHLWMHLQGGLMEILLPPAAVEFVKNQKEKSVQAAAKDRTEKAAVNASNKKNSSQKASEKKAAEKKAEVKADKKAEQKAEKKAEKKAAKKSAEKKTADKN